MMKGLMSPDSGTYKKHERSSSLKISLNSVSQRYRPKRNRAYSTWDSTTRPYVGMCMSNISGPRITLGHTEHHWPMSSWWLQMPWRQICTRASATTILARPWLQYRMNHITQYAYHCTHYAPETGRSATRVFLCCYRVPFLGAITMCNLDEHQLKYGKDTINVYWMEKLAWYSLWVQTADIKETWSQDSPGYLSPIQGAAPTWTSANQWYLSVTVE